MIEISRNNRKYKWLSIYSYSEFTDDSKVFTSIYQYITYHRALANGYYIIMGEILNTTTYARLIKINKLLRKSDYVKKLQFDKYKCLQVATELKFEQNPGLKAKLIETRDKMLVAVNYKHIPQKNTYGRILMNYRKSII